MIFIEVTDKETIIETLAKDRRVEALVENIAHHSLTADLKDLCQMVYLILLEYDESKLQDLSRETAAFGRTSSLTMRYHSGQFHHRKVAPSGMTTTSRWSQGGKERHQTIPGMQQSLCLASNRKDGFYILKCEDKDRNN